MAQRNNKKLDKNNELDFNKAKDEKEKPTPNVIAQRVIRLTTPVEFVGNVFYRTANGFYMSDDNEYKKLIFKNSPVKTPNFIENVLKIIKLNVVKLDYDQDFPVRFNNGILINGLFKECNYTRFTPYVVNASYNPNAKPVRIVDDYLNFISNEDNEYRKLIEEVFGYTLIVDINRISHLAKFFVFVGNGENGKGTLLKIIATILGNHNTSSLSIKQIGDPTYSTALKNSLVNLGDDINNEKITTEQLKMLKNISTGDLFTMRGLYREPEEVRLKTTLIFTSNHILKSAETTHSYQRRIMWLPLYRKVNADDPYFFDKVTSEKAQQYWIKILIEGYKRLYENNQFTKSKTVERFNLAYHKENNNTIQFCEDIQKNDILNKTLADVYEMYQLWCDRDGFEFKTKVDLKETIENTFSVEYKQIRLNNGKRSRCFVTRV